jgi:hypothetical protein
MTSKRELEWSLWCGIGVAILEGSGAVAAEVIAEGRAPTASIGAWGRARSTLGDEAEASQARHSKVIE